MYFLIGVSQAAEKHSWVYRTGSEILTLEEKKKDHFVQSELQEIKSRKLNESKTRHLAASFVPFIFDDFTRKGHFVCCSEFRLEKRIGSFSKMYRGFTSRRARD